MIVATPIKYPSKSILIGETDLDTSYRRIHANEQIASTCITIIENLSLLCIQLTFGTAPVLTEYTTFIKAEIELINNILTDN